MASILVRDISPELESSLREYALPRGLSLSQAAVELMRLGMESETADEKSGDGLPVGDFLVETLKEVFHTKDEAEEFIHSHEEPSHKPRVI